MCGRYGRRGDKQKIAEAFHVEADLEGFDFGETFDAAPGSFQPVVYLSEDGERELGMMRWRFKLPDRLLFNVRSEGVASAKFWKDKFAEHRCIGPASSYFEWQDCDTKPKPKYEIEIFDREYFGIAGVWAPWKNPKSDQWEKTFATFTSEPNALIEKIHIRQPIVIEHGTSRNGFSLPRVCRFTYSVSCPRMI
jgi:putative SOS response-associated peptidase YedK